MAAIAGDAEACHRLLTRASKLSPAASGVGDGCCSLSVAEPKVAIGIERGATPVAVTAAEAGAIPLPAAAMLVLITPLGLMPARPTAAAVGEAAGGAEAAERGSETGSGGAVCKLAGRAERTPDAGEKASEARHVARKTPAVPSAATAPSASRPLLLLDGLGVGTGAAEAAENRRTVRAADDAPKPAGSTPVETEVLTDKAEPSWEPSADKAAIAECSGRTRRSELGRARCGEPWSAVLAALALYCEAAAAAGTSAGAAGAASGDKPPAAASWSTDEIDSSNSPFVKVRRLLAAAEIADKRADRGASTEARLCSTARSPTSSACKYWSACLSSRTSTLGAGLQPL